MWRKPTDELALTFRRVPRDRRCTTYFKTHFSPVNIMQNSKSKPPMDPRHVKVSTGYKTLTLYVLYCDIIKLKVKFRHEKTFITSLHLNGLLVSAVKRSSFYTRKTNDIRTTFNYCSSPFDKENKVLGIYWPKVDLNSLNLTRRSVCPSAFWRAPGYTGWL